MIIIGYQGIGKSTVAKEHSNVIDLESGCFWHNGKRPDNWYVYYCNIAEHLSQQGNIVFVSSHKVVRDRLKKYSNEAVYVICPSHQLKYWWINKLHNRFDKSNLGKDYKAWMNAVDRYDENITELINSGFETIVINSPDYNLYDLIMSKWLYGIMEQPR